MFGKILKYTICGSKVNIEYENGSAGIDVITPEIINIYSPADKNYVSRAIEKDIHVDCKYNAYCKDGSVCIETDSLNIITGKDFHVNIYDKNGSPLSIDYTKERAPFKRNGKLTNAGEGVLNSNIQNEYKIMVMKEMLGGECFYGLGDKTGYLNKKGYYYEMWNTDNPSPHVESFKSLYKSIPFFITLRQNISCGIFFDNTFKTYFDMGKENSSYYYFASNDGILNYYFIYGPKMEDVIRRYTYMTGRTPLPQMWTLGYQQSRWSYYPESRVMEIAENFRKRKIPCDVIHLDIDYMDGYRVFTWDKKKFEDPKKFLKNLKNMGFKIVTIIDPGVKKDEGYSIYDEGIKNDYFARDKDGKVYVNQVWPGDAVYPDFSDSRVRKWWAKNQKIMTDAGVSGIWNDMNEPASFKGPLPDDLKFKNDGRKAQHKEIHNVYGHLMSKATYAGIKDATNKRPFVITRACYAGCQKYSTVWTGDNHSFWEHLRMSIPMLLNLGISGIAFCGTDIGGFQFDCTPELLSRWIQVGCFTPLFRNHSSIGSRDQEPWAFDTETENIQRKYIELRYRLLPYIYDMMRTEEETGFPLMRPLVMQYQDDERTYEINDEFLCGSSILVAPVVEQGKRIRDVYLPEGRWVDFWSGEVYDGKKYILKDAPIDTCPIFVKEGSIIPEYPVQQYVGEKEITELILNVYPGTGTYESYQDDCTSFEYRNGKYNTYSFNMVKKDKVELDIKLSYAAYDKAYSSFKLKIHMKVNDVKVDGANVKYDVEDGCAVFIVSAKKHKIEIE